MSFEVSAVDKFQGYDRGGSQDDPRCASGIEGFLPAEDAEAPVVSGLESRERVDGHGSAQVVALGFAILQEFIGHYGADAVEPSVTGAGAARAVAVKARQGIE